MANWYNSSRGVCVACDEGMDCLSAGTDARTLGAKDGFARPTAESPAVVDCPIPEACVNNSCLAGNTGVLCAVCDRGFYRSSQFSVCSQCGTTSEAAFVAFLVAVAMATALFMIIMLNRKAPNGLLRPFIDATQKLTASVAPAPP